MCVCVFAYATKDHRSSSHKMIAGKVLPTCILWGTAHPIEIACEHLRLKFGCKE